MLVQVGNFAVNVAAAIKEGYPPKYYEVVQQQKSFTVKLIAVATMIAVICVVPAIWWNGPLSLATTSLAAWVFIVTGGVMALIDVRHATLMLYFEREVGGIESFLAGSAIMRHLLPLDRRCAETGLRPISTFGFEDDLLGQAVVWHSADEGLRSVTGLLEQISPQENGPLVADLRTWQHALTRAREQQIRFCVLMRFGNSTSGQEWSTRKGTAF